MNTLGGRLYLEYTLIFKNNKKYLFIKKLNKYNFVLYFL